MTKKKCDVCNVEYRESRDVHEASILHLFKKQNTSVVDHRIWLPPTNKGYEIMVKSLGWDASDPALGSNERRGIVEPIATVYKEPKSKAGVGSNKTVPRVTHEFNDDIEDKRTRDCKRRNYYKHELYSNIDEKYQKYFRE